MRACVSRHSRCVSAEGLCIDTLAYKQHVKHASTPYTKIK